MNRERDPGRVTRSSTKRGDTHTQGKSAVEEEEDNAHICSNEMASEEATQAIAQRAGILQQL
jgi:hypothetical protein